MNIRQKFIALFLSIGLIPTLVIGVVSYVTTSRELSETTRNQLTSIAVKQQQKVNGLLQKKQEEVTKLANKYDFQVALGQYLASGGTSGGDALEGLLQTKKAELSDIKAINVSSLNGIVIASTVSGSSGQLLASQDYTVSSGEETTTTVREDERDGINKLYINTKVSVNKQEAAYLSVIFRIDDIVAAIQDYTGLGASGETVIGEKNAGGEVVSLFPLRFNTDAALATRLTSLNLFSPATQQPTLTATDYRGAEVMVAPQRINAANWVIATKIDVGEAFAPITALRNTLLLIIAASSLIIVAMAFSLTRYVTTPILQIARLSQQIGAGDFSARVNIRRRDEIGVLAERVNAMGDSLKDFVNSIEAQRNRLEIILNSTTESILAIDKNGTIMIANRVAHELTQLPEAQLIGHNINDIFVWSRDLQPFVIDYAAGGTNAYTGLQYTDAAGSLHYVNLIVARVSAEQERQGPQTIITIHDETKSRELENMKVDFVSMAAHELRTPLAAIRGYLELLSYKDRQNMDAESDKYLSQALKSTAELGSLITNLLDVTRIERGTLTFNLERFDLAEEIRQAVDDARFTAEDKRISVRYDGPDEGLHVVADKIALHEVVNNLLTNAIKYTLHGGQVTASLESDGDELVARFSDTGIGIPRHAMEHLFTKFYRVHGGLNSGSTGTGLGLFISKSIVERHGGTITVESEEGKGSTFTVRLPAAAEGGADTDGKHVKARRHRGWVTKNIAR